MKQLRQFATITVLFVVLILIGLLARNYLEGTDLSSVSTPVKTTEDDQRLFKKADYIAALPHFGPLIHTQDISVTYADGKAMATLDNAEDSKIRGGQKVILFNQKHEILPLAGKVEIVDGEHIIIALPEETDTALLSPDLQVITLKTVGTKRIPIDATLQDDEGKTYVWIAESGENRHSKRIVKKQFVDTNLKDDHYLDPGFSINAMDWVILNPDDKLSADKKYRIAETKLDAPLHDPVRQAWGEFELRRLEDQQEELLQRYLNCKNGVPNTYEDVAQGTASLPDGSTSSSCGASEEILNDPVAIFNSLINNLDNANGDSACGNVSSACSQ